MSTIDDVTNQALALHQAGQLDAASKLYARVLEVDPAQPAARHFLGVLKHQTGATTDGARLIRGALVLAPDEAVCYGNLSTLLLALADSRARRVARFSLCIAPEFLDGRINLATAELHAGAFQTAIDALTSLVNQFPGRVDLIDRLAVALEAAGRFPTAIPWRRRSLCLAPDAVTGYRALADAEAMGGNSGPAREQLHRHATVEPSLAARFRAAHSQDRIPLNSEEIRDGRARLSAFLDSAEQETAAVSDPHQEIGITNFILSYQDLVNRDLVKRVADFYLRACPDLAWTAPHCRRASRPSRRVRVAVISAFLGSHTIGKLYGEVLSRLPRPRFEVVAISPAKALDAAWVEQMRKADYQVSLSRNLRRARQQIAEIEADIILYLDIGMDPLTYFLAFSRLAPVQAVSVGHPDTTGVANIDYFLTAKGAEPDDWPEHYSERAILMHEFPFYYLRPPETGQVLDRADLGMPASGTLYTCPQTLFKMHPGYDPVFLEILRRDPNGRLMLIESAHAPETERVRARLAAAGPDVVERVHFQKRMNGLEYLDFVRASDVLVETFAFAGGNSTYEALSTGTPILAYAGKHMRSRVTADLLTMIELGDCVAPDTETFVDKAVALANDTAFRHETRQHLPEKTPLLFERQSAVDGLARFLEIAVDTARAGDRLQPGVMAPE